MQPRLTTHASAAASSTCANTVEWPLGNETGISPTYGGGPAGTRLWWKKAPPTPFGERFMWDGRRRRGGRTQAAGSRGDAARWALVRSRAGKKSLSGFVIGTSCRPTRIRCTLAGMRTAALALALAALAAVSVTAAPAAPLAASASCAKASLSLVKPGVLTVGTD